MMISAANEVLASPPKFEDGRNSRQKARASGLDPNYWYVVEHDGAIKNREVKEIVFWGTSIAVYRGEDGQLAAVQNRCPHRQLKLSKGVVENCKLHCMYHGWSFDRDGQLVGYSHDSFGKPLLNKQLRTYPVQVRYGFIWLFPGDPEKAAEVPLPEIPEVEGPNAWASVPIDFTWAAHHSMIIDNVCDFAHAFLHRKYRPFTDAKLRHYEADDKRVYLTYDANMGGGRFSGMFVDRSRVNTKFIELCYEYPYQWSNTGGSIRHWCFLLPIGPRQTRAFFLFYFDSFKIPGTSLIMPQQLMQFVLRVSNPLLFKPLLTEDGIALEAEQNAYDRYWDEPPIELNPVVPMFQQLTVRKWEEHLARTGGEQVPQPGRAAA